MATRRTAPIKDDLPLPRHLRLNLTGAIPPTLIVPNEDDKADVVGSKIYDAALIATKVPHAFAFYPIGGHGYGLHCTGDGKAWPDDVLKWLRKVVLGFGK